MAVDEAILRSCADGCAPPTFRIYSWERPSISLGYLQQVTPDRFDLGYCREAGIDVVRRITGGKAVMHGCDVTFSIALRESDLPEGFGSVLASHQWLMSGIVTGMRLLGLDAEIGPDGSSVQRGQSADCFAHVAECDIRIGRDKVVGSAQVRKWGALLEQGSIPYSAPEFNVSRVSGRAASIGGSHPGLPPRLGYADIEQAIVRGFGEFVGEAFEAGALTEAEMQLAADLACAKYATEEWTTRRPSL